MQLNKIEAAFYKLGLSSTATEAEVVAAFRKLSKKYHPDTGNGNDKDQKELNLAYNLALQVARSGTGLILAETCRSLEEVNRLGKAQQARNDLSRIVENKQREISSSFKNYRNISVGIAALAAFIALAGANLFPTIEDIDKNLYKDLKPLFGIVTFISGVVAIYFQSKATTAQHKIDDYLEQISDIKSCASELASFLQYKDMGSFDENMISKLLNRETGNYHFRSKVKLLLLKSQEHGLIERIEEKKLTPGTIAKYKISETFNPNSFKMT